MFSNGFIMINTAAAVLSTAITQNEVDRFSQTVLEAFKHIKPELEKAQIAKGL